MATDVPQTEEEEQGVGERDKSMKKIYEDRIIKKEVHTFEEEQEDEEGKKVKVKVKATKKVLVDNFEYETENTIDKDGKTVSKKVFKGGYKVYLND